MKRIKLLSVLVAAFAVSGCATTGGGTPAEKRAAVNEMRQQVLAELYRHAPSARDKIRSAPGYAVFSNANINVILASFGGGYGVVHDNRTGQDTYMNMGEVGLGFGLGVKDFRAVFVFNSRSTMERFIESGWEFGAHADAAAKAGDKGKAASGEVLVGDITIYQLTESGLALQATVKGTKYWKAKELN